MTRQELAQKIKTKYPSYQPINDDELVTRWLVKYPQYQKQLSDSVVKKPSVLDKFNQSGVGKTLNVAGKVFGGAGKTLLNPTINAIQTGIMQPIRGIQEAVPGGKTGREVYKTPFGENKNVKDLGIGERIMQGVEVATAGLPVESIVKTPLTKIAEKLYQSGMKPRNIVKAGRVIQTARDTAKIGVEEGIWLTKGGVERVASKIDDFEAQLGEVIEKAGETGAKIKTSGIKEYLNTAKEFFANDLDVEAAKSALKEIDNIGKNFLKEYGEELPLDIAQKIKVSTGQALKKYYNTLSGASQEARKQGVRFLKDQIVEAAPKVGEINKRLSNLYKFDQALLKARGRIGNLNLLGLASRVGVGTGSVKGAVAGKVLEILDGPALKSGVAIALDRIGGVGNKVLKGVKVPLASLMSEIVRQLQGDKDPKDQPKQ